MNVEINYLNTVISKAAMNILYRHLYTFQGYFPEMELFCIKKVYAF